MVIIIDDRDDGEKGVFRSEGVGDRRRRNGVVARTESAVARTN